LFLLSSSYIINIFNDSKKDNNFWGKNNKWRGSLLEKVKLAREINDGKNEILHKFLGRKI